MLTLFVLCSRVHNFVFLFLFNVKLIEMKIIQFALQPSNWIILTPRAFPHFYSVWYNGKCKSMESMLYGL